MSNYNIDWQSGGDEGVPGKEDIILPQKTIDTTSTSIALTGKGVPNYGEIQQENFIRLMENFASKFPPANPTIGQIWYNTEESILYLRVDPDLIADQYARYFPESPAAWIQIWPHRQSFASLQEYSAMAAAINKVIGSPNGCGSSPVDNDPNNQFGWGQTDLVPEYDSLNQLKAGFDPLVYPTQFDNSAWAILLSRLRKTLRHVGLSESLPSSVGFIDDGRPPGDGNALANQYNDALGAGTLPNITAGWGGASFLTLQLYYAATISAISSLNSSRFAAAGPSLDMQQLAEEQRTSSWSTSVYHDLTFKFEDECAAKAFFNSGGKIGLISVIDGGTTVLSLNWQNFLSGLGEVRFDYNGALRVNTATYDTPPAASGPVGYYDLTSAWQVVFEESRNYSSYYYSSIYDGGLRIWARKEVDVDNKLVLFIRVVWRERDDVEETPPPGDIVDGTLVSYAYVYKASSLNINSPEIAYPEVTSQPIVLV